MSKTACFLAAVVLGVIAVLWWFAKWLLIVSAGMEDDSGPGGAKVAGVLLVWGIIFLVIILCLLGCLARALSPVHQKSGRLPPPSVQGQPQEPQRLATPDEKLAHLVKKP